VSLAVKLLFGTAAVAAGIGLGVGPEAGVVTASELVMGALSGLFALAI
jgi:hypothetical protein